MPLFTHENAAQNGSKGAQVMLQRRLERKAAEELARLNPPPTPAESGQLARTGRIERQIDATIKSLEDCEDDDLRVKLTAALDRLWNLVYPRAGVSKPPRGNQRRSAPVVSETPQETTAPTR